MGERCNVMQALGGTVIVTITTLVMTITMLSGTSKR